MTIEEARKELINFEHFKHMACNMCNNEWYCPTPCEMLLKAERIDFELILKSYARNDGDWYKVFRYIKDKKERQKNERDFV